MLATVRNRRGIVSAVEPFGAPSADQVHLVTVEYTDAGSPPEDQLLWEREPGARVLEPTALPEIERAAPMPTEDFDALVRAARWTALSPFVDPDGTEEPRTRWPVAAPFHAAIQIEDFQLVPLLKALRMPRVALLLADDVGLGKTVEAGLILTELLLRRRVRRVLVICPASLRDQWCEEMRDKFALSFDEVDRERTHALRKRLGMDANPWRSFPRIVTSYDYLKQADVLEAFLAASRAPEGSPHLPWDLLIVDEAHNLAPAPFGEESDLSRMLRLLAPHFEHKLFLTATPHNGRTQSFTGLLERLDPVRFSQKEALTEAERRRVEQVLVRRLKREINDRTDPPPFPRRHPEAIPIALTPEERALAEAFQAFRVRVRALIASGSRGEQQAGAFAVEVLGKRLLSCPVAFADSWHRYQRGLEDPDSADIQEVQAAARAVREDTRDDQEAEGRTAHAARTVGAWLKPLTAHLRAESEAIRQALDALDLADGGTTPAAARPRRDARFEALCRWTDRYLRDPGGSWVADERLVIFTEYKTTLDSLESRLRERYPEAGAIRVLYGGMDETERKAIKTAFNDPADPVRILVATDAASEGLNLQETARYLLHSDVPWNPARLEQRNGRLDRHGQSRDVTVFHFTSDDDADLKFLAYVVQKVDTIREDLGSMGEVFDAAFARRLVQGAAVDAVQRDLDIGIQRARGRADIPRDATPSTATAEGSSAEAEAERLRALAEELDLDPASLRDTLEAALAMRVGRPRLEPPDARGRVRLRHPVPPEWQAPVDDTLRLPTDHGSRGPLPALVFDARYFVQDKAGRPVFRPERDTVLLHLAHPLVQRVLAAFAHVRFPGRSDGATRWTVRQGAMPDGVDALLLLTVEELGVNELRESVHHWVRTFRLPIRRHELGAALSHVSATRLRVEGSLSAADMERARALWEEVARDVRRLVADRARALTDRLRRALDREREAALRQERERFLSRQGELSALIEQQTLARIEREIGALETERRQGTLFDPDGRLEELLRSERAKREELERRREHYEELRAQLGRERERVVEHLIPRRYALRGEAQVFPVAVEIRLPGAPG
jgi:superfamily II DNA or RNA helicase